MKGIYVLLTLSIFFSCNTKLGDKDLLVEPNFLTDFETFTHDSLVNVVIEIPAGCNQKWEVNKTTGRLEWEQITPDSLRVINYLPYPANYGFAPQTLLPAESGGDGDPVDVFVLGESIARQQVVKVQIVGIIHMLDDGEADSKLLAVNVNQPAVQVTSLEMLESRYPGVVDIIKIWLQHYKGEGRVEILGVDDDNVAIRYLKAAYNEYIEQKTK